MASHREGPRFESMDERIKRRGRIDTHTHTHTRHEHSTGHQSTLHTSRVAAASDGRNTAPFCPQLGDTGSPPLTHCLTHTASTQCTPTRATEPAQPHNDSIRPISDSASMTSLSACKQWHLSHSKSTRGHRNSWLGTKNWLVSSMTSYTCKQ
jgi:hypothetical protein